MKIHYHFLLVVLFVLHNIVLAQTTIHGFVSDASTKERLIGANVRIEGTTRGTTTNSYGFFSLPGIDSPKINIRISFLGYESKIILLQKNTSENEPLEIFLNPSNIQSQEVIIEADRYHSQVLSTSMGVTSIPILQIQTLPSVGGEVDLLKAVQLQSGVSSGNELSNGIYVRGGSFDQNLILLDGVTIYNPNHLFGFFSIFNTDAVKNVELIKGGITAEYGGRLSSVLSFTLNDGNLEKTVWKGGVSLIASRLSVEGPISDEKKGSYLLSVRRSYFDTFLWAIGGFKSGGPDFYIYDITAKTNYSVSENDRVFLSGYFGRDNLKNSSSNYGLDIFSIDLAWGNQAYSARWNHLWSPNFFSNVAVIYSDYTSEQKTDVFNTVSAKEPSVKDIAFKADGEYYFTENQTLLFGSEYVYHRYRATAGLLQGGDEIVALNANELQNYISHDWKISDELRITNGIRADYFSTAKKIEIDPRLNIRYMIADDLSLKASYTRMHQFIHLLSTAVFALPGDVYYPATEFLKPQTSQQTSLGIFSSLSFFNMPEVESSVEVYYKDMNNLPMFRQKFSSPSDERIQQDVVIGKGWAYGIDIQLNKNYGAFTGWLSYSFLSAWRQFDEKNGGRAFRPKFERTHQLNIVLNYSLSEKWRVGTIFILASGQPITVPRQKYFIFNQDGSGSSNYILDYGNIYSVRLPMYNRLDISLTREWGNWELFMNLFNVYAYPIPLYTSYFDNGFLQFNIGFIPTVGVNFKF